jgi:hypothetical protein
MTQAVKTQAVIAKIIAKMIIIVMTMKSFSLMGEHQIGTVDVVLIAVAVHSGGTVAMEAMEVAVLTEVMVVMEDTVHTVVAALTVDMETMEDAVLMVVDMEGIAPTVDMVTMEDAALMVDLVVKVVMEVTISLVLKMVMAFPTLKMDLMGTVEVVTMEQVNNNFKTKPVSVIINFRQAKDTTVTTAAVIQHRTMV